MPIVIKEMHVRTTVEKRIIAESEVSDELIKKIEDRVVGRLSVAPTNEQPARRRKKDR